MKIFKKTGSGFEDYFDKDHEEMSEKLKKITAERNFYKKRLTELREHSIDEVIRLRIDAIIEGNGEIVKAHQRITDLQTEVASLSTDADHAEVDVRNLRADVARLTAIVDSTISKEVIE